VKAILEQLCGFTAPRSPAAIMSSVRITREFAYATDGPSSMRVMWDGPDCDIAITAPQLQAALAGMADDQHIKIEPDTTFATLRAGRRKLKLRTVPDPQGIPEIKVEGELVFKDVGPLADALQYALVAASKRDTVRPEYCAVCIDQTAQGTHVIGLDGYRAHLVKVDSEMGNYRSLVPRALAERIVKLAKLGGQIALTDDRVVFRKGDAEFIGVLQHAGKFPAWQRVMRPDESKMFKLGGSQVSILAAAQDAQRFSIDTIVLHLTKRGLQITGRAKVGDEIEHDIEIDYSGPEIEIGVNPVFLADAINSMGDWPTISIAPPATGLPLLLQLKDRTGIVQTKRL